jgi:1-acyl-sn-glycerol-3-phosphate acyltransferase
MIGTDKVQPIGKRVPNIRRIGMIFGEPLDFSRYYGMEDDRMVQRSVTDEIMYELMRLSSQEYVDEYAAVVKLRLAGKAQEASPVTASANSDAGQEPAAGTTLDKTPGTTPDKTPGTTPDKTPGTTDENSRNPGAPTAAAEDGPELPGTA